jgi:hypothetical protein
MISDATKVRFAKEVAKYPADQAQSAVMACLAIIQQELGHVSTDSEQQIADYLGMAAIAVHEVTTFYNMYNQQPVGSTSSMFAPTCRANCAMASRHCGTWSRSWVSPWERLRQTACSPCNKVNAWVRVRILRFCW